MPSTEQCCDNGLPLQLLVVASLTADGNIWGSTSMLTIIGLYSLQVLVNGVSHVIARGWGNPIAQNVIVLAVFVVLSAWLLYVHLRRHLQLVARALSGLLETSKLTSVFLL